MFNFSTTDIIQIIAFAALAYATIGVISLNAAIALFGGGTKPSIWKAVVCAFVPLGAGLAAATVIGGFFVAVYALTLVACVAATYKLNFVRALVVSLATVPCALVVTAVGSWLIG